jgi:predicted metal-dependent hydrolase
MHYEPIQRKFVNGESFMYLGRNYSLQIYLDSTIKKPEVKLFRGEFIITSGNKNEEILIIAMELWYSNRAEEVIKERIKYYQKLFNITPKGIKIKEQKKRWISCTLNNELLFNWKSIIAKSASLDYIIVHEMCHMLHKNHTNEFWELVASMLPDYKARKEWLRNYDVRMDL